MLNRAVAASAILLLAGTPVIAQNTPATAPAKADAVAKLAVGSKAPELSIDKWLKGSPVTGFEKGQVYVVEFWATWCGPCVASMPHLTELQKQFKGKGVTVVSITSEDPNNSLSKAEEMVAAKGMGYTVAWDKGRTTYDAYMTAAEQRGIPCSYVVDKAGTIAFIGHPMWLDSVLPKVADGSWDPKADRAAIDDAETKLDKLFETYESDPRATLKGLEELEAQHHGITGVLETAKVSLLFAAGETEKGYAMCRTLFERGTKDRDSGILNFVARTIVDPNAKIEKRDLDLAFKAVTAANDIEGGKKASVLSTLARVYSLKGDAAKAVEIQKKALELAPDYAKANIEKDLKEYEAAVKK